MEGIDYLFKVISSGNSGVGKRSYLIRVTENFFSDNFVPTIGVDFVRILYYKKRLKIIDSKNI